MSYYGSQSPLPPPPPLPQRPQEGRSQVEFSYARYPAMSHVPPPPARSPPGNHGLNAPNILAPPPIPPRPPGYVSQPKQANWNESPTGLPTSDHGSYEFNASPSYPRDTHGYQSSSVHELNNLQKSLDSIHLESRPYTPTISTATVYPSQQKLYSGSRVPLAAPTAQPNKNALRTRVIPSSVVSCIDTPMGFATEWYWHPRAPDYLICSRCYVDHIFYSRFRNEFECTKFMDGQPRICRFSKPRMKDNLFKVAMSTGSLQPVLDWMNLRTSLPDCKGETGVKADAGVKWFRARNNAIPDLVFCQTCYEDYFQEFASGNMESANPQPVNKRWSCDMAIPFIRKEFEKNAKTRNWANFVAEAKSRMMLPACLQNQSVKSRGRAWFSPLKGPTELVFCGACFCDQILHSDDEANWKRLPEQPRGKDKMISCDMGNFIVKMAIAVAQDAHDFSVFWKAMNKLSQTPQCDPTGITSRTCYTFRSHPHQFGVCEACYVGILEPLNISRFFVPKQHLSSGGKLICAFNSSNPRFQHFVARMLETYFLQDDRTFEEYAVTYASILPCPRENEVTSQQWYGWNECTICVECYHDFARHSPLADWMVLRKENLSGTVICDLYSPRMRGLYTQCSASSPPDPRPLLDFAVHRAQVFASTVPIIKSIIASQRTALAQQNMMNTMSTFYTNSGQIQEISLGSRYTYSAPGVGYGFHTLDGLRGAEYGQAANNIMMQANDPSRLQMVKDLEKQWRGVE